MDVAEHQVREHDAGVFSQDFAQPRGRTLDISFEVEVDGFVQEAEDADPVLGVREAVLRFGCRRGGRRDLA
jgi:hypothetical protein